MSSRIPADRMSFAGLGRIYQTVVAPAPQSGDLPGCATAPDGQPGPSFGGLGARGQDRLGGGLPNLGGCAAERTPDVAERAARPAAVERERRLEFAQDAEHEDGGES